MREGKNETNFVQELEIFNRGGSVQSVAIKSVGSETASRNLSPQDDQSEKSALYVLFLINVYVHFILKEETILCTFCQKDFLISFANFIYRI